MKLFRIFSSSTNIPATPGTQAASAPGAYVGESTACPEGGRLHAKIEGRYVTVLRVNGKLSCIDSICFHAGGPLGLGDIEDIDGHACLVCPWHFYKIDIETGDKYYQSIQFTNGKMVGGEWKTNGVRQRVHTVVEENGKIYVTLSKGGPANLLQTSSSAPCGPSAPSGSAPSGSAPSGSGLPLCAVGGGTCPAAAGDGGRIDSDGYAYDSSCGERILNAPPSANRTRAHAVGADGRKPSEKVRQILSGQYHS